MQIFGFLCLWIFGLAAFMWTGTRLLHNAFGWFAVQPDLWETVLVAWWATGLMIWITPGRRRQP